VFKWTTKYTEIPLAGTIVTGTFTALLAFFMSLDSLSNAISVGTLLAFNLVNAGVMVIRYTPTVKKISAIPISLIAAYCVFCFISATLFVHDKFWGWLAIFTLLALVMFILLTVFHIRCDVQNIPTTFKCPLVPLVPCIGIAINSYMLAGLDGWAWVRLAVWLVIGWAIYFFYGIWNSKLRQKVD